MSAQGSGKRKSPALGVDLVESDPEHDDDLDILVESTDSISDLRASCASSERTSSISEDNEILDYDSVSSPGGSSTASGPIYVRPPGFDHHAHEITSNVERSGKQRSGSGSSSVGVTRATSVLSRHAFTSSGGVVVKKKKGLLSADFKGTDAQGNVVGRKKIEGVAVLPSRQKARKGIFSFSFIFSCAPNLEVWDITFKKTTTSGHNSRKSSEANDGKVTVTIQF